MLVAAAVYGLLRLHVLPGGLNVLVFCAALCLLPTSDFLSRRIALAGTIVLGWTPLLWWFRWPFQVDHGALVAAVVLGALAASGCSRQQSPRQRRIWPVVRPVDALPLVAGGAAALLLWRWFAVDTPARALALLLPGYDNVAHFSMFEAVARNNAMPDQVGLADDGTPWHYAHYPQGFHALAATLADVAGQDPTGGVQALPTFAHCVGGVVVATTVVLVAALCSLPPLRRRPLVALPAVGLVFSAYLLGPGGTTIADGFAPFWFASALVSIGVLLAVGSVRVVLPLNLAAIGGTLVGVAQSWAPLCLLLLPACAAVATPRGLPRWRAPVAWWGWTALLTSMVLIGVARPVLTLAQTVSVREVVSAAGGFSPPEPTRLLLVLALASMSAAGFPLVRRRLTGPAVSRPTGGRIQVLGLVVLVAVLSASCLLIAQIQSRGRPDYYFFKYVLGIEVVLVTLLAIQLVVAGRVVLDGVTSVMLQRAIGLTALLAAPFVVSSSPYAPDLLDPHRPGTADLRPPASVTALADHILSATREAGSRRGTEVFLAMPPGGSPQAAYPESWLLALTGTWTVGADRRAAPLVTRVDDPHTAASVAARLLKKEPALVVLVPPVHLEAVRRELSPGRLASRVQTWRG